VTFRTIKQEIRILGIDDGAFFDDDTSVLLVGTICRAGTWLDGVLSTHIKKDGLDATEKIVEMVNKSRHKEQVRVIMLDGITFGGFNIVDIKKIFKQTSLPVIVVNRTLPNFEKIEKALQKFSDASIRLNSLKSAGEVKFFKNLYYQHAGIDQQDVEELITLTATRSIIPEPIRIAHLIAGGITRGESKGRP
jgi:hypothetical protein